MSDTTAAVPDYRDTVFLPQTDFPMRAALPQREPEWLARWERIGIYDRLRERAEGRSPFILHDGPPYANGNLHIGHALNKTIKDIIVRSHQMMGRDARYVPGWDCHGLPIEWKIEEKYRKDGRDKDAVDVVEFRQECRRFAAEWVDIQRQEFKRLGVTGKWDAPYLTMDYHAEAVIAAEFMKLLMNGALYQGSKPVMWSPVEKTALAEAEVEYHDHTSHTIWVRFRPLSGLDGASVVIWTTTPWTIPQNRAVAYNPQIAYSIYRVIELAEGATARADELLVLADALAESVMGAAKVTRFERLRPVPADELAGLVLAHPLRGVEGAAGEWDYDVPMLPGDHVTEDAGTGFVHTAPSHGDDDYQLGLKFGLPMTYNVEPDGSYRADLPLFGGQAIIGPDGKEGPANVSVIKQLAYAGALLAKGKIKHSYPHSWRSKAPLIYRNTPQWFASIDKPLNDGMGQYGDSIRSRALNSIDKLVKWWPQSGRNRIHAMVENRPDWVLSRQRAWGVPLTCFVKRGTRPGDADFLLRDQRVNDRIIAAFEAEGADVWYRDGFKAQVLDGIADPDAYDQVMDVLDVWFDSGSTHAFVLRDRADGAPDGIADLYLEGTDQHRGWFQSSLLQGCATKGRAPYRNVVTHGFTLDEKGMKMSKSLGNTIVPAQVIEQYGADILRLWVAQTDYTADQRIGPEILKGTADSYRRLRNTLRFILGNLAGFAESERVEPAQMPELEQWVLHRLAQIDQQLRAGYAGFDFQGVFQTVFQFATVDLSAFYFDIRKDALYCDAPMALRRRAARTVLDILFHRLVTWLAPILPFTMEDVWLSRFPSKTDSVHLHDFPVTPTAWLNETLAGKWDAIRRTRRVVTAALEIKRTDKVIGASLEASPIVHVEDAEVLRALKSVEFADICITSGIGLTSDPAPAEAFRLADVPGIGVVFEPAEGEKCQRCWKILPDVGNHRHPGTCARCDEVLGLD
ncbi:MULTISPECIES: isoleucine--tRNA ligase [unclassified Paracoccus (in: a-proteobacteria)]|uniref:isoleucine--tRNA ligase n=1 Tax=unclassified Paracoccus (in: a-proteobacteria) TaxID=2688777 RepID=UPI0012B3A0E7|nr:MULTISPECIES: isoleucine--tRNA ligase [unclassified Paracoccus (in: a-proteobacteria)]UXU74755.1 isoleucine--tRNA ligase [Paracoccus sp. SMMA_5]UXU80652.1 isoleucine--tRNA ligase [Paracoccus sp. SMMA_5_TC]